VDEEDWEAGTEPEPEPEPEEAGPPMVTTAREVTTAVVVCLLGPRPMLVVMRVLVLRRGLTVELGWVEPELVAAGRLDSWLFLVRKRWYMRQGETAHILCVNESAQSGADREKSETHCF
jgi:hypothetical protein